MTAEEKETHPERTDRPKTVHADGHLVLTRQVVYIHTPVRMLFSLSLDVRVSMYSGEDGA